MTGPRGARCTGVGEGPPVCTRRFQETRPEAESGVTAWREPRWSAERRARPAWTRGHARSANRWQHLLAWRGPTGQSRLSALRLPSFYLEAATVLAFVRKTRMRMHRENEIAYSTLPACGESIGVLRTPFFLPERRCGASAMGAQRPRVRGPLRDSELIGSLWWLSHRLQHSGSVNAPSPLPLPACGEREPRASCAENQSRAR